MRAVILDSEAISRLARAKDGAAAGVVHTWVRAAADTQAPVVVPAAVLAEQYRGGRHDQILDACLARYPGIAVVDTTRPLARQIGHLSARAGSGSQHHVDATVIAVALAHGGGAVLTSDPDDLAALAEGNPAITIVPV
ncbi:MAG: type II toxin-antitoxin system VapC family toxin [Frankiaceae bacterium]|jgi:predicted nucleic acid-binding protein|nr:type II toxin-antitoxin system VapC family toxin [Frankiaceae bacterium]